MSALYVSLHWEGSFSNIAQLSPESGFVDAKLAIVSLLRITEMSLAGQTFTILDTIYKFRERDKVLGLDRTRTYPEIMDEKKQHWQFDRLSVPAPTKASHGLVSGVTVMFPQISPRLHTVENKYGMFESL